jgi:hypothetical protein
MNEQQTYVFNQYYIDLLKKIKSLSKETKETNKDARNILRSIKKNFSTMDKLTTEYTTFLENAEFWSIYDKMENPLIYSEEFMKTELYKEITIGEIVSIAKDIYIVNHYIYLLYIFHIHDLQIAEVVEVIKVLNNPTEFEVKIQEITNEIVSKKLIELRDLHTKHSRSALEEELKEIESTSLGKLAKEIMADINIEDMQKTMNDPNMNIFESMQNPNSGFGKVLSSVSQKMLSKIGSGELQQDDLLKDAINLATKIPSMLPNGMGSQLGNIGAMLEQLQKMNMGAGASNNSGSKSGSKKNKQPEMNPMDMMQSMMSAMGNSSKNDGQMNPMDMMKTMMDGMNLNKNQQTAAKSRLGGAMNKHRSASRLKAKLLKKQQAKEAAALADESE